MSTMKVLLLCIMIPCITVLGGCGATRPEVSIDRTEMLKVRTIAILPFSDAPGADGGYSGKTMTLLVGQHLMSLPNVQLVEREKIKAILTEQDFQMAMMKDDAKVARIGMLIGADTIVVGAATQYSSSSVPMMFGDLFTVGVSFRLVRVETARICFSGYCTQNGSSYEEAGTRSVSLIVDQLKRELSDHVQATLRPLSLPKTPSSLILRDLRFLPAAAFRGIIPALRPRMEA